MSTRDEREDSDAESASGDEGAELDLVTPIDIPEKPAFLDDSTTPVPFNVEKDCAFLLLEARMILRAIMEHRLRQERILSGNLSVDEIQNLLRSQKEDSDKDWITRMQPSSPHFLLLLFSLHTNHDCRNPRIEEEIGG
jgi:Ras GTPase-activating-like protein IQGAP2/3